MTRRRQSIAGLAVLAALVASQAAAAGVSGTVAIDAATQRRLGVATAPLQAAHRNAALSGFARVLDPAPLVLLDADIVAAAAAAVASRAEANRTRLLNAEDATVSTKVRQAAEAQAGADEARLMQLRRRVGLEWGAGVAQLSDARRSSLARALAAGNAALLRIDTAQGQGLAGLRGVAIDLGPLGVVPARVIGPARTAEARMRSPGLLALAVGSAAQRLSPGLTAVATLGAGAGAQGVLAPRVALVRTGGRTFVYVRRDAGHFDRRAVDGGEPQAEGLFVAQGLAPGEPVVVAGAAALLTAENAPPPEPE